MLVVQAVLDAGLGTPLVGMLKHDSVDMLTPALRAVGNIVSSNDHQHTEQMCQLGVRWFTWCAFSWYKACC